MHSAILSMPMQQGVRTVRVDSGNVNQDVARLQKIVKARMEAAAREDQSK